jgi:hypothetical protein
MSDYSYCAADETTALDYPSAKAGPVRKQPAPMLGETLPHLR